MAISGSSAAAGRGTIIISSSSPNNHQQRKQLILSPLPRPYFLSLINNNNNNNNNNNLKSPTTICSLMMKNGKNDTMYRFITKAADSTTSVTSSVDKPIVTDEEFTLAKISFGVIGLGLGVSLLAYGFGAYFNILPGSEWSAIMLTYGFPLAIIGMALKYAELKPVPCLTYADAEKLRETCATDILEQVRNDVIRYRYGDEQHLEEALKRIFQYGLGSGIPRRSAPTLKNIREEVTEDGKYCLTLVFEAKALELSDFEKRQAKFTSFFGPGITAEIGTGDKNIYEVRLISDTTP